MPQSPGPRKLLLRTRGFRLARAHSIMVADALQQSIGLACDCVVVNTHGECLQHPPLAYAVGKVFFTNDLDSRATSLLATDLWLPSLARGAVGIEIRTDDEAVAGTVAQLDDRATALALACERAFQAALDGSCRTPIAGLATSTNGTLRF